MIKEETKTKNGKKSKDEKYLSNSILRGLAVLKMFNAETPTLSLAEIASKLGVSRTTPYRILYTLEECGYIYQDPNSKRYGLKPKVLELGFTYLNSLQLPELVAPYLEKLRDETNMSAHMGVLNDKEIVYVARYPARGVATIAINVGSHLPVYATSMGKCLLAHLPEKEKILVEIESSESFNNAGLVIQELREDLQWLEKNGYIFHKGEFEKGIWSVACPIIGKDNTAIAAINVATSQHVTSEKQMKTEVIPAVCETAKQISSFMAHTI